MLNTLSSSLKQQTQDVLVTNSLFSQFNSFSPIKYGSYQSADQYSPDPSKMLVPPQLLLQQESSNQFMLMVQGYLEQQLQGQ